MTDALRSTPTSGKRNYGEVGDLKLEPDFDRYVRDMGHNQSYEETRLKSVPISGMVCFEKPTVTQVATRVTTSLKGMQEVVTIFVGPNKDVWTLHKDLMIADSLTARALFESVHPSAPPRKPTFPFFAPEGMEFYASYLYTGDIPRTLGPNNPKSEGHEAQLEKLLKAYAVGDQLASTRFMDLLLEEISSATTGRFETFKRQHVMYIMQNLSKTSPLRRFCVDLMGAMILNGECKFDGPENVAFAHMYEKNQSGKFGLFGALTLTPILLPPEYKADFMDGVIRMLDLRKDERRIEYHRLQPKRYMPHSVNPQDLPALRLENNDEVLRHEMERLTFKADEPEVNKKEVENREVEDKAVNNGL